MGRGRLPGALDVTVDRVGGDGLGEARVGQRLLKVKNALAGERVTTRVLRKRRGVWWGMAEQVDAGVSTARVQPGCAVFPRCGGCAMQHLDYSRQLRLKESLLLQALEQAGVVPQRVVPAVAGPRYHYRSKARFGVRFVGGEALVGFRESFSSRVGRMDTCPTLVPALSTMFAPLRSLIAGLSNPERIPQVEMAAGENAAAMVLRHLTPLTAVDRARIAAFGDRYRVRCYTQSGGYDSVTPASVGAADSYLDYGNPDFGLHFLFRPTDFTQVNLAMNRLLVRSTVAALDAPPGARVVDLFCGIGNFSLALASRGLQVTGLESAPAAIERASLNAARNGLAGRCEFAVQDLYDADCSSPGPVEYMVLDPPRSGAGPNLEAWLTRSGVRRMVYVSCSPASFAGDAAILDRQGFTLEQVGIFDMFPHTAHVETLGVFQKRW